MLSQDIILDLMSHVRDLAGAHPELVCASDMTTNGYLLTAPRAVKLIDLRVTRFQISFDGPRELHDKKRIMAGGKGTFDQIWENLLALRGVTRAFKVTVRVHVARDNVQAMEQFIDDCADAFHGDGRYELFIRGLARLGGNNDEALPVYEAGDGELIYEGLRQYARSRGLRVASKTAEDAICYAARANSYVVRANGRLNKCTIALEHPNNQVGRIHEDGKLEVNDKVLMWMRGLRSGDEVEMKCPMKGYADTTVGPVNGPSVGTQIVNIRRSAG